MADAYQCLDSLRTMLNIRREEVKEKMARGLDSDDSYREQVGRAKALKDAIDRISDQIKSINGDVDETPAQ